MRGYSLAGAAGLCYLLRHKHRPQHLVLIAPMSTAATLMTAQPIAGVSPAELREVTVMTVWPSIAQSAIGRGMGQAFAIKWPDIYIFRLGNLLALLSIPLALPLFF